MIMGKSILAVIPARGGSKELKNKNLHKLHNKSLLAWSIEAAKRSVYIDSLIVSSEDQAILDEAKICGADVPFVRPSELAKDDTPGIEPILHALQVLPGYDYVIVLQVTSPLRTTQDIDNSIGLCVERDVPACVSVTAVDKHPYWMFTLQQERLISLFPDQPQVCRQSLPSVFCLNGAIYVAKIPWLFKHKNFISEKTLAYLMPKERAIDIDTSFDLLRAESRLGKS